MLVFDALVTLIVRGKGVIRENRDKQARCDDDGARALSLHQGVYSAERWSNGKEKGG